MFSLDFPLKNTYANLGYVKKHLTLNGNCNINKILFGYSFHLQFPFPTYCLPTQVSRC